MIGVLQADDELVAQAAELAVEMQVGLIDEVIDLLPSLVGAEGDCRSAGAWVVGAESGGARPGRDVAVVGSWPMAAIGTSTAVERPRTMVLATGRLRSEAGRLAFGLFLDIDFS